MGSNRILKRALHASTVQIVMQRYGAQIIMVWLKKLPMKVLYMYVAVFLQHFDICFWIEVRACFSGLFDSLR